MVGRLDARLAELRDAPVDLPAPLRWSIAVERQLPSALGHQHEVVADLLGHDDHSHVLDEAAGSLALRRPRRPRQPREIKDGDRIERRRLTEAVRAPPLPPQLPCTLPSPLPHPLPHPPRSRPPPRNPA